MPNTQLRTRLGLVLLAGVLPIHVHAQQGSARSSLPSVGSQLPAIEIYDDDGQVFNTATLQGSYTVLVFGCLT